MTEYARPRLVLSRCLELEKVRYNGEKIAYDFVRQLEPFVDLVPVCPEVEIGLGVPRDPIRLIEGDDGVRLYQPSTGRDLTKEMEHFSDGFLSSLPPVDGFVLKNRSPSCGISDVKLYTEQGNPSSSGKRPGMFGQAVLDRFSGLAVEDEGRLRNFRIREHFLTKLFALAALRGVAETGSMHQLIDFHARYKFVLMAYDQTRMRELGRLVANGRGTAFQDLVAAYREAVARWIALSSRARAAEACPAIPPKPIVAVAIPRWARTALAPVGSATIAFLKPWLVPRTRRMHRLFPASSSDVKSRASGPTPCA
ncbi:MAG: DUF523 and DUF1722 domain-containing protein, partial [Gemmatimonadales bacterium]